LRDAVLEVRLHTLLPGHRLQEVEIVWVKVCS